VHFLGGLCSCLLYIPYVEFKRTRPYSTAGILLLLLRSDDVVSPLSSRHAKLALADLRRVRLSGNESFVCAMVCPAMIPGATNPMYLSTGGFHSLRWLLPTIQPRIECITTSTCMQLLCIPVLAPAAFALHSDVRRNLSSRTLGFCISPQTPSILIANPCGAASNLESTAHDPHERPLGSLHGRTYCVAG